MENTMRKTNIHHAIIEVSDGAHSLKDVLLQLVGRINDLEYRLSRIDKLPYPARDENGELRYDIFELKEVK